MLPIQLDPYPLLTYLFIFKKKTKFVVNPNIDTQNFFCRIKLSHINEILTNLMGAKSKVDLWLGTPFFFLNKKPFYQTLPKYVATEMY